MVNQVSDAMSTGFSAADVKTLSQWIAARQTGVSQSSIEEDFEVSRTG